MEGIFFVLVPCIIVIQQHIFPFFFCLLVGFCCFSFLLFCFHFLMQFFDQTDTRLDGIVIIATRWLDFGNNTSTYIFEHKIEMALQKTAYDACSRKIHCVKKGYLEDPFVGYFAQDSTIVNSPLMSRGTWLRTTAIENCILSFARRYEGKPIQVISFGAGVDTLFFRLRKYHPKVVLERYIEFDLPDLVLEKHSIIAKHSSLSSLVIPAYRLLAADLRESDSVVSSLKRNAVQNVPTIILAEMVFVYIEEPLTTKLLSSTIQDFMGGVKEESPTLLITYDAIMPHDRFGKMMRESLHQIGVDLPGITGLPTPEAHAERCRKVGFRTVKSMTMRELYLSVPRATQEHLHKLEMVDDWDEWNLMHDHYCFLIGSTEEGGLPTIFS